MGQSSEMLDSCALVGYWKISTSLGTSNTPLDVFLPPISPHIWFINSRGVMTHSIGNLGDFSSGRLLFISFFFTITCTAQFLLLLLLVLWFPSDSLP